MSKPLFKIGDVLKHNGRGGYGSMVSKNNGIVTVSDVRKEGFNGGETIYGFLEDSNGGHAHWCSVEHNFTKLLETFEF